MSVEKYIIRKEQSYTVIPNKVLQNLNNYEALGLYSYLCSLPPGWEFYKKQLMEHGNVGREKLNNLLKILKNHDLIEFNQIRDEKGQFSRFELHVKDGSSFKINDLTPLTEKPLTANRLPVNSTYKRNKEKENKTNKENIPRDEEKIDLPIWLSPTLWKEYLDHRKFIKSPISITAQKKALTTLTKLKEQGFDHIEVINQTIINGWKGFFAINDQNRIKKNEDHARTIRKFKQGTIFESRGEQRNSEPIAGVLGKNPISPIF